MKIAIGDSFAYGEELSDRRLAWPSLIGYDNLGLPGASNEYIFRTAVDNASTATHMIVGWSDSARHEIYTYDPVSVPGRYINKTGLIQVNAGNDYGKPWFRELYGKYTDLRHQFIRTLTYMVALQDVLSNNAVDYRYCSAFSNQSMFLKYKDDPEIVKWTDRLDNTRFIGYPYKGFVEWAYGTPQGPGGHPLELGHRRIADEILRNISN